MHNDMIDVAKIDWLSRELADQYQQAHPFPYIAIDDFLDESTYHQLSATFPGPDESIWTAYERASENLKLQSADFTAIPPALRTLIMEFNSAPFLRFLERVSGIEGLQPDPHLHGGGLHQTLPGGHLGVHVDYNYHPESKLYRRLNVLYYLNDTWQEEWNGHLQLWSKDMKHCVQNIAPLGNRLAIFNTDEHSWHGHPDPLASPQGTNRRSVALYYYTNGAPKSVVGTEHSTKFRLRPGERRRITAKDVVLGMTPPYFRVAAKRLLGRV